MATKKIHVVPFRRKREGKTNYKKRLRLLLSHKLRLVIRKSLKNIIIQFVEYDQQGDKIILSVSSKVLERDYGWKINKGNAPSAYLTGLLAGLKAKQKGINDAVFDIGLQSSVKGSRIYAAVKGVIDSGITVPCSEEMLPNYDIVKGIKIAQFSEMLKKSSNEKYQRQFSHYLKQNVEPEKISTLFEDAKQKILLNFKG